MGELSLLPQGYRAKSKRTHASWPECSHSDLVLDEHRRLIECTQCGYCQDPFDYLWSVAMQHQAWRGQAIELQRQKDTLYEEHAALSREVRNLKAQRRRAIAQLRKVEEHV